MLPKQRRRKTAWSIIVEACKSYHHCQLVFVVSCAFFFIFIALIKLMFFFCLIIMLCLMSEAKWQHEDFANGKMGMKKRERAKQSNRTREKRDRNHWSEGEKIIFTFNWNKQQPVCSFNEVKGGRGRRFLSNFQ